MACFQTARILSLSSGTYFNFASMDFGDNHNSTALACHSFLPGSKKCSFCASERTYRRPIELVFGWTEEALALEKPDQPIKWQISDNIANGEEQNFVIGGTIRDQLRFVVDQEEMKVSAATIVGERTISPAEAREIGKAWIEAKREIINLFSWLARHSTLVKLSKTI